MSKRTISDRLVSGLLQRGWRETRRLTKYRVFYHGNSLSDEGAYVYYFVGRSGALRSGTSIGASVSRTGSVFYARLLLNDEGKDGF